MILTQEQVQLVPYHVGKHNLYEAGLDFRVATHKLASPESFDYEADRKRSLDDCNRAWTEGTD